MLLLVSNGSHLKDYNETNVRITYYTAQYLQQSVRSTHRLPCAPLHAMQCMHTDTPLQYSTRSSAWKHPSCTRCAAMLFRIHWSLCERHSRSTNYKHRIFFHILRVKFTPQSVRSTHWYKQKCLMLTIYATTIVCLQHTSTAFILHHWLQTTHGIKLPTLTAT